MAVTVSGMFGNGNTYFSGSPVVIDISNLEWGNPPTSPFTIVRIEVLYNGKVVGNFYADTGGQTSISFDISSALRAIWHNEDFRDEADDAGAAYLGRESTRWVRGYKQYSIIVYTEYIDSKDGQFTQTKSPISGTGQCAIGWLTEWERRNIGSKENAHLSHWEHQNLRNGDASTKPTSSPERVGSRSITSWVDIQNSGTQSIFYPATAGDGRGSDDTASSHPPIVLRDTIPYTDFLFVNRRGAVETCSGQPLEALDIDVDSKQYANVERPSFISSRSLMAIPNGLRRTWSMSSGHQTREWAVWWATEFLMARRWWMLIGNEYVPVIVTPAKQSNNIYDRSKQQMPSVEFTVTMALEG